MLSYMLSLIPSYMLSYPICYTYYVILYVILYVIRPAYHKKGGDSEKEHFVFYQSHGLDGDGFVFHSSHGSDREHNREHWLKQKKQ